MDNDEARAVFAQLEDLIRRAAAVSNEGPGHRKFDGVMLQWRDDGTGWRAELTTRRDAQDYQNAQSRSKGNEVTHSHPFAAVSHIMYSNLQEARDDVGKAKKRLQEAEETQKLVDLIASGSR